MYGSPGMEWYDEQCPRGGRKKRDICISTCIHRVDAYLSAETTAEEAAESGKVFRIRTDLSEGETLNIGGYVISRSEGKIVGDRSAVLEGCDEVRTVGATPVIEGAAQLDILVNEHLIEIFVNDGQYVLSHVVYGKSKKISGKYEKVLVGK